MTARVWMDRADPPECGRRDFEWWWTVSEDYRPLEADELGRKCSVRNCPHDAVVVRPEWINHWKTRTKYTRRSFRCEEHVYQRFEVHGGCVLVVRIRIDRPIEGVSDG